MVLGLIFRDHWDKSSGWVEEAPTVGSEGGFGGLGFGGGAGRVDGVWTGCLTKGEPCGTARD